MNDGNYIKINRSILEWEWYKNINTKTVFLHMLLKAYWKDTHTEGEKISRGSFISSIKNMAFETALTENEVRTAILHLKTTGEITSRGTNKNTVFTVNKYDFYQTVNEQNYKRATNEPQTINKPLTTNKEYKEGEEDNKKKDTKVSKESRFAPPTQDEVRQYCMERNNSIDAERFLNFYAAKGWMIGKNKMKDWKAAVRTWENKERENASNGPTGTKPKQNAKSLTELAIEAGIGDTPFEGF